MTDINSIDGKDSAFRQMEGCFGIERLLLFGAIAKDSWVFAVGGKVQVDAFIQTEPLLQIMQGKRVKDIMMADDALETNDERL